MLTLILLFAARAWAGGGPSGFIVVYDSKDLRSATIANYYQNVRGIPERNMVPYHFPSSFNRSTAWDFVYYLRETLAERGIDEQLQGIAIAGVVPLASSQTNNDIQWPTFSIQGFLFLSPTFSHASFPTANTWFQRHTPCPIHLSMGPLPLGRLH